MITEKEFSSESLLMKRFARVAKFTVGCEHLPFELGPSLATILAAHQKKGRLSCLCKCLYPFFLVLITTDNLRRFAFFNAYDIDTTGYTPIRQEILSNINRKILALSETSNIDKALLILREIGEDARVRDQLSIKGQVPREASRILANFVYASSIEDISFVLSLQPNIEEREVVELTQKLAAIYDEMKALKKIISLVDSIRASMLERIQQIIDDAFDQLDAWKSEKIDDYMRNLHEHQDLANSYQGTINELDSILSDNMHLLNEINDDITRANDQMRYADASDRYRLGLRVSELKRQRERALTNRKDVSKRKENVQASTKQELEAIHELEKAIQEVKNTLPEDLKKSAKDFESLRESLENVFELLETASRDLESILANLIPGSDDMTTFEDANVYKSKDTKISICLVYVPIYLVLTRRFLGLKSDSLVATPCSLPNALNLMNENELAKYFIRCLEKMSNRDFKALKEVAESNSILKSQRGHALLVEGIRLIKNEELVAGLENGVLKGFLE